MLSWLQSWGGFCSKKAMTRKRLLSLCVVLFAVHSLVGAQKTVDAKSSSSVEREARRPLVLGYYYAGGGLAPSQINYRQFTHLCHAFATPDTSGGLVLEKGLPSRDLTSRAHAQGVKVLLSLGGAGNNLGFGALTSSTATMDRFVSQVVGLVSEYGYDGVDIDWEYPADAREQAGFTDLCKRLREALDRAKSGALLTAAVGGNIGTTRYIDSDAVLPFLDYLNVMVYDMHGSWNDHAGFNAPLRHDPADKPECARNTMEGFMAYWNEERHWPKAKLLVGIPSYGRGFPASKWHEAIPVGAKPGHADVVFKNLPMFFEQGWKRSWNEAAAVPSLSKEGVKEVISYDDEQSVALKGQWAAEHGYPGVFFWEISQDYVGGEHVLVKAAAQAFSQKR